MAEQDNQQQASTQQGLCVNMESVNRISKLPVVESTIQTATNLYEKVKVVFFTHVKKSLFNYLDFYRT